MMTVLLILGIVILFVLPTLKDRVICAKKLIVIPALFAYLLYETLLGNFMLDPATYAVIVIAAIFGLGIGAWLRSSTAIKADRSKQLIFIPGGYLSLFTFSLIFIVQFIVGTIHTIDPSYLQSDVLSKQVLVFFLSLTSTITIGANLCLYYHYVICGTNTHLEENKQSLLEQLFTTRKAGS